MPTRINTAQIKDESVTRADLNSTTAGQAVIKKIIQGQNVTLVSTGVDSGTGDVTINVDLSSRVSKTGDTMTGTLTVPNITFSNPGIGNDTRFTFLKTNDSAWLSVKESASDITVYQFGMGDNPDGQNDYFEWFTQDYQGRGGDITWLRIGNNKVDMAAASINLYGHTAVQGNYYSANGNIGQIARSGTSPVVVTPNVSGFTGSSRVIWIRITDVTATPNLFQWGSGSTANAATASNLPLSTTATTLTEGITVTFSATTGATLNETYQFRVVRGGRLTVNGTDVSLSNHTHTFASLTSRPTTISGYGITDGMLNALGAGTTAAVDPINTAYQLASSGKPLYGDPDFAVGMNSVAVYNNTAGTTVTITRGDDTTAPNKSKKVLTISNNGGASSPGLGGFVHSLTPSANQVYAQIFIAKVPLGYTLVMNSNSTGTGSTESWLTSNLGTGKWRTYVRLIYAGSSGTFSNTGHISLSGPAGAMSWTLAYSNVFLVTLDGLTGIEDFQIANVNWAKVLSKPTTIAGYGITDALTGTTTYATFPQKIVSSTSLTSRIDSGFYQSPNATTANGWPLNNNTWMNAIVVTHSNATNYYSTQLVGDFYTQKFWLRNTNGIGTQAWSEVWTTSNLPDPVRLGANNIITGQNTFNSPLGTIFNGPISVGANNAGGTILSLSDDGNLADLQNGYISWRAEQGLEVTTGKTSTISAHLIKSSGELESSLAQISPLMKADTFSAVDGRAGVLTTDGWLRLNPNLQFTEGVFTPGKLRVDGRLEVGPNGATFLVSSASNQLSTALPVFLNNGNDLVFKSDDPGDIVFQNSAGTEMGRIWVSGTDNLVFSTLSTPTAVFNVNSLGAFSLGQKLWTESAGKTYTDNKVATNSMLYSTDTRSVNTPPTDYNRELRFEFKQRSVVSAPGSQNFGGLLTLAPWLETSGGWGTQLFASGDGLFIRRADLSATSWGNWADIVETGRNIDYSTGEKTIGFRNGTGIATYLFANTNNTRTFGIFDGEIGSIFAYSRGQDTLFLPRSLNVGRGISAIGSQTSWTVHGWTPGIVLDPAHGILFPKKGSTHSIFLGKTADNFLRIMSVIDEVNSTPNYLMDINGASGMVTIFNALTTGSYAQVQGNLETFQPGFVHSIKHGFVGYAPTISLAVGDHDTGLNSLADGNLALVANGATVADFSAGRFEIASGNTFISSSHALSGVAGGSLNNGMFAGTADNAQFTNGNNVMIRSWWGLGFSSNVTGSEVTKIFFDLRTGDMRTKGSMYAESGFYQSSKRSLKENIKPVEFNALDVVRSVQVSTFSYISDESKVTRIGFIADDTDSKLSGPNKDNFLVTDTIAVLLKAVQELSDKVKELEEKLNARD